MDTNLKLYSLKKVVASYEPAIQQEEKQNVTRKQVINKLQKALAPFQKKR